MKVPYSQQFSPKQTPLEKLLPILRQNARKNKADNLRSAIASAFFKDKADPHKLAGNTISALRYYGIIDDSNLATDLGKQIIACQGQEDEAHKILAKHILLRLDGVSIVETLKDMSRADLKIELKSLPNELRQRGFEVSKTSSDLSSVLGWLRMANVLKGYSVNATQYQALVGASAATLEATRKLNSDQFLFLKAILALNVQDWTPYNVILKHAEELYAGQTRYNWKDVVKTVLTPLQDAGLIELRKRTKKNTTKPEGRGGKVTDIKPAAKFEKEIAEPLLETLYKAVGYTKVSAVRSMSLNEIVADIRQKTDTNKSGKALEYLAVRLCLMLDLEYMGLRETDVDVAAGGEIDAMMESTRLIYSRWQVQCKVGKITFDAAAKEVGVQKVSLANVILIVSTSAATSSALTYRKMIVSTTNLNIIFIDGTALNRIIKDNSVLIEILRQQAQDSLALKPTGVKLRGVLPSRQGGSGSSEGNGGGEIVIEPSLVETVELAPAYTTGLGRMYCGDALDVLRMLIALGYRAKLIMTSPPFALVKKKEYDNEDAESYIHWFEQFIPLFKQILAPDGSLVIDIGGAWIKGLPAKSIYQFKLLIRLCESGFYLAHDFYHYNPAKLPTPAEWVTVRRLRVKDAVNNVWWLTLDPFVDADNRRVLNGYSDSMKTLLKNGYKPGLRPSGHDISDKFQRDNGGAIPSNLLQYSNTESNSHYLRRCKEQNIKPHPARFPQALPEFFINFLTSPGDLIIDTFAGSNVTGAAAEILNRQWISIELKPEYVEASKFRFEPLALSPPQKEKPKQKRQRKAKPETEPPTLFDYSDKKFVN
jgi:site-specific DNA-methyltransferase (cytosine-N4-specific)